ncbi:hypothetical protein TcYC6_0060640 [Trypanosoma cruzi]|nr:hypothetical protein TcYC6_0060640 [Trypanosoma cruzi]
MKYTNSNGLQEVSARERQAPARQRVAHQSGNTTTAPSAGLKKAIMARNFCRYVTAVTYFLEKNDVRWMLPQSRSKRNIFYGREACNVKLPNIDEAIHLGAMVLVDVTATGDINGVNAAKRSRSFVRQSAGRPPHLPAPSTAWNLLEGWSRLGLRRARSNALLHSRYAQPKPQHRDRVRNSLLEG